MVSVRNMWKQAYTVIKEEGPRELAYRARRFVSFKVQYLARRGKREEVKQYKERTADKEYNHDPKVSFALQSFNRVGNVDHLATRIPQGQDCETIVLEDGSIDGSLEKWDEHLTRRNDFLIRSNDLHEIRTYTRGAQFARGDYLCLLQDDDTLPEEREWIDWLLEYFESYPDLAVVGGYIPVGMGESRFFDSPYDKLSHDGSIPPIAEWTFFTNEEKFPLVDNEPLPLIDPATERPLVFVPMVSVGPYIVKMEAYERLGGFDFDFSEPGMPGVMFDAEFSLRCWENGYKVGYVNMGNYDQQMGGTYLYAKDDRQRRAEMNIELIQEKHGSKFELVEQRVCDANGELTRASNPSDVQGLNLTG